MKYPSQAELDALSQIASLKADQSRAMIANARRRVASVVAEIEALAVTPVAHDPASAAVFEKWLVWRQQRRTILNAELALARAHLDAISGHARRDIAREEVVRSLCEVSRLNAKRRLARAASEAASLTSPGGRYQ